MDTNLHRVQRLAVHRRDAHRRLLRRLRYGRRISPETYLRLQQEAAAQAWTEVDCCRCANCCASLQLQMTARDCVAMAKALGLTPTEFRAQHAERHRDGLWYLKQQPCLSLRRRLCAIYEDRPSRCRGFPYLEESFLDDIAGTLQKAEYCPLVLNVLEQLTKHPDLQPTRGPDRR
jgi:Fe-S-cluster containining protein